jgi:PTS system trehalose-specific IIC component
MIGDGVAFAVRHLMTGSFAPIGAALFGFLYAPLVITGSTRPRWLSICR